MKKEDLKKYKLPDKSGVYFFKKGKSILYVGKATSLKDRVRSYFNPDVVETRGPRIVEMVEKASTIKFTETDSVLEAIILESQLIKKYEPPYNIRDKDNKSFNYIIITKEDFPKILQVRGRELAVVINPEDIKKSFGPFPSSVELRTALKIIRKIFPYRDKCTATLPSQINDDKKARACFNHQIGLCPGVCVGIVSKKEYAKTIRHLTLFFEGKKRKLVSLLEKEMKQYAKDRRFEKAGEIKKKIFALKHINDIALIARKEANLTENNYKIEAYDIAHTSGQETVGVMVSVNNGIPNKDSYRRFIIKDLPAGKINDTMALKEVLERRLNHSEWILPNLVVVDGGKAQVNTALKVFELAGIGVPVVGVVKDERHRPKNIIGNKTIIAKNEADILTANHEAHRFAVNFHRLRRGKMI